MTSNHINFGSGKGTIGESNIRSVMIKQNRVLLYRRENNDYWILPGDDPFFGETTKDAIRRRNDMECQVEQS